MNFLLNCFASNLEIHFVQSICSQITCKDKPEYNVYFDTYNDDTAQVCKRLHKHYVMSTRKQLSTNHDHIHISIRYLYTIFNFHVRL